MMIVSNEKETQNIAKKISRSIEGSNLVLCLNGDLGSGKTTFTRYLIRSLQSNKLTNEIPSPTFNIVNEYKIDEITINHYDLFKLKDPKELYNIGLFENNPETVTLVEWPGIISNKPKNIIELYFSYENDFKERRLEIFSEYRKEIINEFK